MKTPCCNFEPRDYRWPVYCQGNGIVQCHNCGEVYVPKSELDKLTKQNAELEQALHQSEHGKYGRLELTQQNVELAAVLTQVKAIAQPSTALHELLDPVVELLEYYPPPQDGCIEQLNRLGAVLGKETK